MKKLALATFFGLMVLLLSGCATLSQEDQKFVTAYRNEVGHGGPAKPSSEPKMDFEPFIQSLGSDPDRDILICEAGVWIACPALAFPKPNLNGAKPNHKARAQTALIKGCVGEELKNCFALAEFFENLEDFPGVQFVAKTILSNACENDDFLSCGILGAMMSSKVLGFKDLEKSRTYLSKGCHKSDEFSKNPLFNGCDLLAASYLNSEINARFIPEARLAYQRACDIDNNSRWCIAHAYALRFHPGSTNDSNQKSLDSKESKKQYEKHCLTFRASTPDEIAENVADSLGIYWEDESQQLLELCNALKIEFPPPKVATPSGSNGSPKNAPKTASPATAPAAEAQPVPARASTEPTKPASKVLPEAPAKQEAPVVKVPPVPAPIPEAKKDPCEGLANGQAVRIKVKGEPQPQSAMVLKASDGQVQVRIMGSGLRERRACSEVQKGN